MRSTLILILVASSSFSSYAQLKTKAFEACEAVNNAKGDVDVLQDKLLELHTVISKYDKRLFGKRKAKLLTDLETSGNTYLVLKRSAIAKENPCKSSPELIQRTETEVVAPPPPDTLSYIPQRPIAKADQIGQFINDLASRTYQLDTKAYFQTHKMFEEIVALRDELVALRVQHINSKNELMCYLYQQEEKQLELAKLEMNSSYRRASFRFK